MRPGTAPTNEPDPHAEVEVQDKNPLGEFDPDFCCGAEACGEACAREPHPPQWQHIATSDESDLVVLAAAVAAELDRVDPLPYPEEC